MRSRYPCPPDATIPRSKRPSGPRVEQLEARAAEVGRLEFYNQRDKNWRRQLGSLGSGNHFIELVFDEQDRVWTFLHSGSRGIGNKIADFHIKAARQLMEKWFISLPDPNLAYLVQDTQEFRDYLTDLEWAQEFALLNRAEMTERVLRILAHRFEAVEELERIECHHNFTKWENHFGKNILVSRKGRDRSQGGPDGPDTRLDGHRQLRGAGQGPPGIL